MAKRETASSKYEAPVQKDLFADQPKTSQAIDRNKIDTHYALLKEQGKTTCESNGYSFKCLICKGTYDNPLYVREKYCLNCDLFHGE